MFYGILGCVFAVTVGVSYVEQTKQPTRSRANLVTGETVSTFTLLDSTIVSLKRDFNTQLTKQNQFSQGIFLNI